MRSREFGHQLLSLMLVNLSLLRDLTFSTDFITSSEVRSSLLILKLNSPANNLSSLSVLPITAAFETRFVVQFNSYSVGGRDDYLPAAGLLPKSGFILSILILSPSFHIASTSRGQPRFLFLLKSILSSLILNSPSGLITFYSMVMIDNINLITLKTLVNIFFLIKDFTLIKGKAYTL